MGKKSAGIHPSTAHQPALLTDKCEGTPQAPPALHQLQREPLPRLGLHTLEELEALKNSCAAALREPFPKEQVQTAPQSCSQSKQAALDWPFLTRVPRFDPKPAPCLQLRPLCDHYCPLFHCTKDGSTRPLHPGFLHSHPFLK